MSLLLVYRASDAALRGLDMATQDSYVSNRLIISAETKSISSVCSPFETISERAFTIKETGRGSRQAKAKFTKATIPRVYLLIVWKGNVSLPIKTTSSRDLV